MENEKQVETTTTKQEGKVSFVVTTLNNRYGYYSFACTLSAKTNLFHYFDGCELDGSKVVELLYASTAKKAKELAKQKNKEFVKNGTFSSLHILNEEE